MELCDHIFSCKRLVIFSLFNKHSVDLRYLAESVNVKFCDLYNNNNVMYSPIDRIISTC